MNRYEMLNQERMLVKKILRVGAYCRVSTDNEDQANSFESQQRYFKEYITRNPEWQLTEIFADDGISGTSTKKRKAFNRMIASAKNGEVDLIITKEISRFARNTLDSIYYTRELKKHGVGVIFLNDNINTLDADAELRLTIMSSIAQEESRKTSERVKWGQKRRMEQGVVFGRDMLGYDVRGGEMFINEKGAKIVRLIFDKFVNEGKGTHTIARELREAGIKSYNNNKEWSNTAILRIIRNEKYCGDLVQKKTYTPDYLSHDKKYNRGQEEFVIIKNHHEPIISREIFDRAAEILDSRALSQDGKAKHSNRYAFSGKIKCGCCGSSYSARYKNRKDGSKYKAWRCLEGTKYGAPHIDEAGNHVGCSGESIRNEDAEYIMRLVVNSLDFEKEVIILNLVNVIKKVVSSGDNSIDTKNLREKIEQAENKQQRSLNLYLDGETTKENFLKTRDECAAKIKEYQDLIESVEKQNLLIYGQEELIRDIQETLKQMISGTIHDDEFYRNVLKKMVIHDRDHVDVYLNLLPHKWSYAIEKSRKTEKNSENNQRSISPQYVGTEELGHLEMICAIVYQLTKDLTVDEIKQQGFEDYYVDHTIGIYPVSASGIPFSAGGFQSKGDPVTDLIEDLAAEQKARTVYENILRLTDDDDVRQPIKFLRAREITHFQRFGETLEHVKDQLNCKNFYAFNPAFDKKIK